MTPKKAKKAPYSHGGRDMTRSERMHRIRLKPKPKPTTRAERRVLKAALEWLAAGIYRHPTDGDLLGAVYALRRSITKETDEQIMETFPRDQPVKP